MQPIQNNSSHSKRTNSHIMGFFALLLLIVVVAISVDRLRQSQDVRKEASVVCPQAPICTDGTQGTYDDQCQLVCPPAPSGPTVTMSIASSGPFYLYNFYDDTVEPTFLGTVDYEITLRVPRSIQTIDLTFRVPASAQLDDSVFIANEGISVTKTKDEVVETDREITLSFSEIALILSGTDTPISLGKFRARPTELGAFSVALPADKNPFITIVEGSELQTAQILPSLEVTPTSLEPGQSYTYRVVFSAKNINPNKNVYLGKITFMLKRGSETTILQSTGAGLLSPNQVTLVIGNFDNPLQVGDEIIVSFQPSSTEINELPETGILTITQEMLDNIDSQQKFDLDLQTFTPLIKQTHSLDDAKEFGIEYGLEIKNSTNTSQNPITAQNVVFEVTSSQEGVTAYNTRPGSNCTNNGVTFPVVLHCTYANVGGVLPLRIKMLGASPGAITFTNKLTVLGNPERESNPNNNTLSLYTTITTPTTPEYDIADIAGGNPSGPDGFVDLADYTLLKKHLGKTGSTPGFVSADFTSTTYGVPDGSVDLSDYSLLVAHLGR
ncbi:MAG: hypothetical protein O2840_03335 [bacterium]|nr:hypothetical protein [bacterium]